jgi:hypothetical protein
MSRLLFWAISIPILVMLLFHLLHIFYFAGKFCRSRNTMEGETVIVTGANTGGAIFHGGVHGPSSFSKVS